MCSCELNRNCTALPGSIPHLFPKIQAGIIRFLSRAPILSRAGKAQSQSFKKRRKKGSSFDGSRERDPNQIFIVKLLRRSSREENNNSSENESFSENSGIPTQNGDLESQRDAVKPSLNRTRGGGGNEIEESFEGQTGV